MPRIPERPRSPDGKFGHLQLRWALDVIGWENNYVARVIHSDQGGFRQMLKGRRLIPTSLGDWFVVLANGHIQLWRPAGIPSFPEAPQGAYRGVAMQEALHQIGWRRDVVAKRLNLPRPFVDAMALGYRVIPENVAEWLEALVAFHKAHPHPVGWRAKVPAGEDMTARDETAEIDAA